MKYQIINTYCEVISTHKTLELANAKLKKIDAVKYCLHASDVDWLKGKEEALQGYKHSIIKKDK